MRVKSKAWSVLASLVVMSVLLSALGCANPAATPTQAPVPTPTAVLKPTATPTVAVSSRGDLRIGTGFLGSEALDPILLTGGGFIYVPLIYDFLVGTAPGGKLSKETGLASDWQVSSDGLTHTFSLRKGAKFQNGDEVTADDVKFSLERAMSEKSRTSNARTFRTVIKSMDVADPYTLVIHLNSSYLTLPYLLSPLSGTGGGVITPKKYIQEKGEDYFNTHPIGSGPYRSVSQTIGSEMKLEAVPSHWRVGVPKYKTITFKIVGEPTTLIASLRVGEADIISLPINMLSQVAGYNIAVKRDAITLGLLLHQQWENVPYHDIRVRESLAVAIDRKAINDALMAGTGTSDPVGPMGGSWNLGYPSMPDIPYDPARAKQLLTDAGFPQGFDFTLYTMPRSGGFDLDKMAEMIAEQWRAIGVKANIVRADYATFRPTWGAKKIPNSARIDAEIDFVLVDTILQTVFHSKGALATAMDPKLDALIDALQQSPTLDEYAKRQGAVLKYLRDNFISIGLLGGGEYYATSQALKGWDPGTVPTYPDFDALITQK